ncbi:DUF927 domain-containing protein [Mesorhizobium sp. RSR565B]|uniref:DUF927 domain-containing protein n=1 Tax=Mesorhizobium sp. L103C565B0 TaxID=1287094 RepID=UPI0003D054C5|nr:DUF927 domain-containing protein [Mesorhizobium sp. L103C565B0]ESZ50921.1 hypothetical protein X730_09405 [Mesorhizobium sp. L103C565B0]
MNARPSKVHRAQALKILPPNFETINACAEYRREALAAAPITDPYLAEKCSPKKRCNSGLCPLCIRALRVRLVEFLDQERLDKHQWFFVTAYMRGWTKKPGDVRAFGQLGSHPAIKAFIQRLHRVTVPEPLMLFGAIETVWRANDNKPTGKPFHLHFMISGRSEDQIKKAARGFDRDTLVQTPVRVDPVKAGWEDFRDAATYTVKQPFWKYSYYGLGPRKKRQFPNRQELGELICNLGPHGTAGRLVFAGMQYKHGRFELTSNVKSMSAKSQVEDGSNNPADAEKRPPNEVVANLIGAIVATLRAGNCRPTRPATATEMRGVSMCTPQPKGESIMPTQGALQLPWNETRAAEIAKANAKPSDANFLKLVRTEVSESTGKHECVLRFRTRTGVVEAAVPKSELISSHALRKLLIDKGAMLPQNFDQCREAILSSEKGRIVTMAASTGWRGNALVTPFGIFGDRDAVKNVRLERGAEIERRTSGTAKEYLAGIKPFLERSPVLILAYIAGLTPSLASRIGLKDSFALNLMQKTSTGKTTALFVTQSLITACDHERQLFNFNDTLGLQQDLLPMRGGIAVPYTDLKNSVDEGKAFAHKIRALVFASSSGKARGRKGEVTPPIPAFSIPMLSSEMPMAELFRENGIKFDGGEGVRLIEIEVRPGSEGGIFIPGEGETSAQLRADLVNHLAVQHGTVLPLWIEFLSKKSIEAAAKHVSEARQRFMATISAPEPHQDRIAQRFSLLAAVGEIASRKKLIPLSQDQVTSAIRQLYNSRIAAEMTATGREAELWPLFFERVAAKNLFPAAKDGVEPRHPEKYKNGFRRREQGRTHLYVTRAWLDQQVPHKWFVEEKLMPRLLASEATRKGHGGGWTARVKQAGLPENKRYLRFDLGKLRKLEADLG